MQTSKKFVAAYYLLVTAVIATYLCKYLFFIESFYNIVMGSLPYY